MRRLFALSLAASFVAAAFACATTNAVPIREDEDAAPEAAAPDAADGTAKPDGSADADAHADADAATDANGKDANGPGEAGATCSFNRECQMALRCECDEINGCACKPGPRGAGQNGVDKCDSGNDCASAVCVEGPPDSGFYCTDECGSGGDCIAPLPLCADITFVGRICVRTPP